MITTDLVAVSSWICGLRISLISIFNNYLTRLIILISHNFNLFPITYWLLCVLWSIVITSYNSSLVSPFILIFMLALLPISSFPLIIWGIIYSSWFIIRLLFLISSILRRFRIMRKLFLISWLPPIRILRDLRSIILSSISLIPVSACLSFRIFIISSSRIRVLRWWSGIQLFLI